MSMANSSLAAIDVSEMAGLIKDAGERSWREALSSAYEVSQPQRLLQANAAYLTGWMHVLPRRLDADARVLSLDANYGATTSGVAQRYASVTHVSLDPTQRPFCQVRFEQDGLDVHSVDGKPTRLPFADGSFDLLVSPLLLTTVDSPAPALSEVSRVLAADGIAVIGWSFGSELRSMLGSRRRDAAFLAAGLRPMASYAVHPSIEAPLTVMSASPRGGLSHLIKARSRSNHQGLKAWRNRVMATAARTGLLSNLFSDYLVVARKA